MATFITLIDFTDQGIRTIGDTVAREEGFARTAESIGVTVKDVYWTVGNHDGVLILEAPNDEIVTALMLALGKAGDVRTHTLRAFSKGEIQSILGKVPKL